MENFTQCGLYSLKEMEVSELCTIYKIHRCLVFAQLTVSRKYLSFLMAAS